MRLRPVHGMLVTACAVTLAAASLIAPGSQQAQAPAPSAAAGAPVDTPAPPLPGTDLKTRSPSTTVLAPADHTHSLSDQDWAAVERADEVGAETVVAELRSQLGDDPTLSARCHQINHELGRRAYAYYGSVDAAIDFDTSWCGGGYVHGVFEGWGRAVPFETVRSDVPALCERNVALGPVCAHGAGHALMQKSPALEQTYAVCDDLGEHSGDCVMGVLMIYSQTAAALHADEAGAAPDAFDVIAMCDLVPTRHLDTCHYESGIAWMSNVGGTTAEALEVCSTVEGTTTGPHLCAEGVGMILPGQIGLDPPAAVPECEAGPRDLVTSCLSGAWRELHRQYGLRNLPDFCDSVAPAWQEICRSTPSLRPGTGPERPVAPPS